MKLLELSGKYSDNVLHLCAKNPKVLSAVVITLAYKIGNRLETVGEG